ncbi:MAG: hypothetical protein HWD92_07520 [Flavobacteriia bacterium]|nr:hypothetical protein [Flavobacteriia bacterium]
MESNSNVDYRQMYVAAKESAHKVLTAKQGEHPVLAASAGCWACEIGLNASIGGLLAGLTVASGGTFEAAVAAVVAATALSEGVVAGILTALATGGLGGVEAAIHALCVAMKACKD